MKGTKLWSGVKFGRGLAAVVAVLLALLSTVPGLAQSGPNTMNFQGRLLDSSGNPLGGVMRCMEFSICTDGSGHFTCIATNVWGPEYKAVTTESGTYKAGLFTVVLGEGIALPPDLFYDQDTLYLEIGVSDQAMFCGSASYTPMEPRSELKASAFAQRSRRVRTYEADDDYLVHVTNIGSGGAIFGRSTSGYGVYSDGDAHVEGDLSAAGVVHSTTGGFRFPDDTIQTSAAEIIPPGVILMWSGSLESVPEGWALCDGTRGTPNLGERFIMGTTDGGQIGASGGATAHNHYSPPHRHTIDIPQFEASRWVDVNSPEPVGPIVKYYAAVETGFARTDHIHWIDPPEHWTDYEQVTTHYSEHLPPYYQLAFMMKCGSDPDNCAAP
jgi:hypothetical protein